MHVFDVRSIRLVMLWACWLRLLLLVPNALHADHLFAQSLSTQALKECQQRDLIPETVFLLGRIGNTKEALTLIIERLGDVDQVWHHRRYEWEGRLTPVGHQGKLDKL